MCPFLCLREHCTTSRRIFKRFLGISLAVTIAVCAILMSFSSQNIIEEKINHFEQKKYRVLLGTDFTEGK